MAQKTVSTVKELVLLGAMNAALILLSYAIILVMHLLPPLWGFIDPVCNFLLAPAYILMLRLVPKPFVMTIHGTIFGLFTTLTGWWPGLLAGVCAGFLADLAAALAGGYPLPRAVFAAVPVFATVKALLFYFPLYGYILFPVFADVISQWPEKVITEYTVRFAALVLAVNLAACLAGLFWGRKMLARHFSATGLADV